MELAAGFMRLNRYVMVYAIVHNFTVQYDICDSQEPISCASLSLVHPRKDRVIGISEVLDYIFST